MENLPEEIKQLLEEIKDLSTFMWSQEGLCDYHTSETFQVASNVLNHKLYELCDKHNIDCPRRLMY